MNISLMFQLMRELEQLRKHEQWTRAELETYQATALKALREYAYNRSPFYQQFHKGLTNAPLQDLPVLTKAMVIQHFDDLVTDRNIRLQSVRAFIKNFDETRPYLDQYWVNSTSGSTGNPGLFIFDQAAWVAVLASFARAHEWAGLRVSLTHRMKMASVASTAPAHMSALVGATLTSWWMPALRLAANEPLQSSVQRLNDWQPDMLVAYASMARILADEQLAGRLFIHPHMVFTSSEVLTDEARHRIEAAWGHPPFNQYAATETGGMAAETTDHNGLHLFEDNVIFEVVDAQYRPMSPGVYGEKLLVTVLFNRTQPLIRYEISDSVRLAAEASDRNWPFAKIDGIQGRSEDILYMPATVGGKVSVHPLTFHQALDTTLANGWQVVQETDGLRVLLNGVPNAVEDSTLIDSLTRALVAQSVVIPRITIQHVAAIPKAASGKTPLIRAYRPT